MKVEDDKFTLPCSSEGGIGAFFMLLLLKWLKDHNYIYSLKKINIILTIDFEYHLGSPTLYGII